MHLRDISDLPTKTDQNDEKNVRASIGFGEVKPMNTDDFLCSNSAKLSTRAMSSGLIREVIWFGT